MAGAVWASKLRERVPKVMFLGSAVPGGEDVFDVLEGKVAGFEEHQKVVDEVCALFEQTFVVFGGGFERHFDTFLTDFLGDFLGAGVQESGGVGGVRIAFRRTERNNALEPGQEMFYRVIVLVPAGVGARVAGRSEWMRLDEEGITVAVEPEFVHAERIAGGLAFLPELLSRAGVERHVTRGLGCLERLFVHPGKHQDAI